MLSRVVYGSRYDLCIAITVVGFALVVGTLIGSISGFLGGRMDSFIIRLMDMVLAFPSFVLALVFVAVFAPTLITLIIALSIWFIPMYARLVRGEMFAEKVKEYAVAAQALGSSQARLVFRHLLPNSLTPSHYPVHHQCLLGHLERCRVKFFGSGPAATHSRMGGDDQ
jgi:ABC-type dipeptide/oligopeptide/nickel transport system permease subunit